MLLHDSYLSIWFGRRRRLSSCLLVLVCSSRSRGLSPSRPTCSHQNYSAPQPDTSRQAKATQSSFPHKLSLTNDWLHNIHISAKSRSPSESRPSSRSPESSAVPPSRAREYQVLEWSSQASTLWLPVLWRPLYSGKGESDISKGVYTN